MLLSTDFVDVFDNRKEIDFPFGRAAKDGRRIIT